MAFLLPLWHPEKAMKYVLYSVCMLGVAQAQMPNLLSEAQFCDISISKRYIVPYTALHHLLQVRYQILLIEFMAFVISFANQNRVM